MELTYKNADGATVTLKQAKPLFLQKLDGIGRIRQTINTFHAPEQDGAFYISSTLDMRNITIEGTILSQSVDESFEYRKQLLKIFTPKLRGTLIYCGRQIACIVEEAGFSQGNISRAPAFFISLLCPSPFFEALEDIRAELASWQENFSFPLEITDPGIELGIRQPSQIITIENEGDVACGCEIVFKALGSVSDPELLNVDTGEFMRLIVGMTAGQEIHVFTHFAGKRVVSIIGTTATNAFSLIDVGSTFLQLAAGRNTLRYDAGSNIDLLEVSVFYKELWLGV
ncbi:hypothetical protein AGMMS50284_5530 [Clostridia bacterium]|nr:hypothetical protein AGMMS50284_5530 [Clostridia bacterium]